jgi:hypothetical protein
MTQDTTPIINDEFVREAIEEDERASRLDEIRSAE